MAERALATAFVNIVPGTKDLELWMKKGLPDAADEAGKSGGARLGNGLFGGIKSMLGPLAIAFSAVGIASFTGDMIRSAEEGNKVDATLKNITTQMGLFKGATDTVVTRLQDFATAQMKLTGIDDDVIKAGQAKLMTFSNVAASAGTMGGAFDQATKLAMDLSAAGFGSVDSASVMLGKALQDPMKGITALQRVGVSLSDSQKKQVEDFMKVNDVASAQKIILAEVGRQVGGTAAAAATPMEKMKAQWDDMTQAIGGYLMPVIGNLSSFVVTNVIPAIQGIVLGIQNFVGFVQANMSWIAPLTAGLAAIALGVTGVGIAMQITAAGGLAAYLVAMFPAIAATWAFTVALLANPITGIVIGIIALITAIVLLAMNWDTVVKWITNVWSGFMGWIGDVLKGFASWWNGLWAGIGKWFSDVWNGLLKFIGDWWPLLLGIVTGGLGLVVGFIIQNWDGIVKFFSTAWNSIVTFFTDAGKNIWNGIVQTFTNVKNFIRDVFVNLLGIVKAPINGLIALINGMIDGLNKINVDIPSWVPLVGGNKFGFNIPHIPALADGGFVTKPTTALIGEAGPEVVTPLKDFKDMMGLNGGAGNGQTIVYNAAPNTSLDSEQALMQALKRAKVLGAW